MSPVKATLSAFVALGLCAATSSHAYVLEGASWSGASITLQLQLGVPASPLIDGSTSWDDVAIAALSAWNNEMQRSQFVGVAGSTATKARANAYNNVFFDSTMYGDAFGDRVLAVTLNRSSGSSFVESDVIVNSATTWNSYRGALRSSSTDLQRVLMHEFGHVLGLGHPDLATPAQTVAAIMNSTVGNIYTLQSDDISGANQLYGGAVPVPAAGTLANQVVNAGSPLTLALANTNAANLSYTWTFTRPNGSTRTLLDGDGNPFILPAYSLFSAQSADAGVYTVAAVSGSSTSLPVSATVSVNPISSAGVRLANLSARARAGSGDDTFIVGLVISGSSPKNVLLRAVGPALAASGISAPLADPLLKLFRRNADGSSTEIGQNDNWSANATEAADLRAAAQRLGAFALPDGSKDAAMLVSLAPGVYSAMADAQGGQPGIALIETYDADEDRPQALARKLVNLSTRSFAGKDEQKLITGFVIDGPAPKQVLIRAVGPGLGTFGVTGVNSDPYLQLFKGSTQIADNDDWAYSNQTDILPGVFAKVGAFQLASGSLDSALLITLPPGVYSAQAGGRNGETGVVLVEVYEVPE